MSRSPAPVRVGIIGLGHNGQAHLRVHLKHGRSRVTVLCERNEDRLREAGALAPETRLTTGDDIYDDPNVDAISIHTGDAFHAEPFVRALAAGKHVFIEKPVANAIAEVERMAAAWRAANPRLVVAVGYVLRWDPLFAAVHDLCRRGELGRIYYLEADYVHNLLCQRHQTDAVTGRNWYLEEEQPIVGGGSHQLDLLRWFTGREVTEVTAWGNHVAFPEMRHDDCQVALFRFDDGALAKVAALYGPIAARPPACNLRVYGAEGTIERDQIARRQSPDDVHPPYAPLAAGEGKGHPYDDEVVDWLDAIAAGREPRTPFWDGANSTLATLAAVEAMREGRIKAVPRVTPEREWVSG